MSDPLERMMRECPPGPIGTVEWARAAESIRRTREAQQQIDDARAEPTATEREAQLTDAQMRATSCTCPPEWRSLTWTQNGPTPHIMGCPDANGGGYSSANDANEVTAWSAINRLASDTLIISGAKLAAFRQLEAAATAARDAQQAMTATGAALRDAIQAMCAAMTGAK